MIIIMTELHCLSETYFASSLSIEGHILILLSELLLYVYVQHFIEDASAMAHYIIIINLVNFVFIILHVPKHASGKA
jgi:hypothetical protein